jgi:DNA-directed RNA polymerase subunit beta'
VKRELDESTGRIATVVIEHKEDLIRRSKSATKRTSPSPAIPFPAGAQIAVKKETSSSPVPLLAKTPRKASKTKDITGGLPRVAELFEARRPKDAAEIARIDGIVSFEGPSAASASSSSPTKKTGQRRSISSPLGKHIIVQAGDHVHKGQHLTEGSVVPHEILEILGPSALMTSWSTRCRKSTVSRA